MTEPKLEAVYYSNPFPRSMEALTILGLVFDRIHLPFVHLPDGGYSYEELEERRDNLIKLATEDRSSFRHDTWQMIAALQFTHWKDWTKDFLYYPHTQEDILGMDKRVTGGLVKEIYDLTFPPRPNFEPYFSSMHSFGIRPLGAPGGSEASIMYAGDYYYSAAALHYAAQVGLPVINDVPMLGMPSMGEGSIKFNSAALSSVLAVECIQFILPKIPQLDVTELLDFRDEMAPHVKAFRLAILRMAGKLSRQIEAGDENDAIRNAARIIVETEIQPLLIELKDFAEAPSRPWHENLLQPLRSLISPQYWLMPPGAQIAKIADGYITQVLDSRTRGRARQEQVKRSPVYYLLKIEDLSK